MSASTTTAKILDGKALAARIRGELAIEVERHRAILRRRLSLAVGVLGEGASRRGVDELAEVPPALDALVQLQGRDQVVRVIGKPGERKA